MLRETKTALITLAELSSTKKIPFKTDIDSNLNPYKSDQQLYCSKFLYEL